jgi:DNA-directed RNA polymerase subunit omega
MARISAQDCLARIPNHFALCIVAARRARELAAGDPPTVICDNKAAVTSLREIAAGKVRLVESLDSAIAAHIADMKLLESDRGVGGLRRHGR